MVEVIVDGKKVSGEEMEIVGYNVTQFEGDKIIIFVKGLVCTKANLHFRKMTEEEKAERE
jgi:hypothetical protein